MYKTITDPYTKIPYPINSKKGNNVLKNYLNYSLKGGAVDEPNKSGPSVLEQLMKLSPEELKSVKAEDYGVPDHTITRHKRTIEKNDKKYKTKFIESTKLTEDDHKRYKVLFEIEADTRNATEKDELIQLRRTKRAARQYNKWAKWKKDRSKFYPNDECCKDVLKTVETTDTSSVVITDAEMIAKAVACDEADDPTACINSVRDEETLRFNEQLYKLSPEILKKKLDIPLDQKLKHRRRRTLRRMKMNDKNFPNEKLLKPEEFTNEMADKLKTLEGTDPARTPLEEIQKNWQKWEKWDEWKQRRGDVYFKESKCCKESDDVTTGIDTLGEKTVAAPEAESAVTPVAAPVAEPLADNISTKSPSPTVDNDGSCWQISVDPNTKRSYWWNTKTKETKWYNPSNNSDVPPINLDEDWECVCDTENCNCTNASKEIPKECVTIFKKYTTALGELKVEKSKTKSIEQLVINLSNKISTLKK